MSLQPRQLRGRSFRFAGFQFVAMLTLAAFLGCGSAGPTTEENVLHTLSNLSEAARDADAFQEFFVEGSVPEADRLEYSKYKFNMGLPKVSGDTATVEVEITDREGNDIGGQIWELVRENDEWRFVNAPLQ